VANFRRQHSVLTGKVTNHQEAIAGKSQKEALACPISSRRPQFSPSQPHPTLPTRTAYGAGKLRQMANLWFRILEKFSIFEVILR
jgi:hypothetical protein